MSMYREGMNGKENSPADQTIQEGSQAAALLTLTRAMPPAHCSLRHARKLCRVSALKPGNR